MTIKNKINALILVGGKSVRMQTDKSKLNYHGVNQTEYLHHLLSRKVDNVYLSVREEQIEQTHLKEFPRIKDTYKSLGPICGILSAFEVDPEVGWLVIAIDLPHVDEATIDQLIEHYSPKKIATCLINPEKKWAGPLFTIYSPKSFPKLKKYFEAGNKCPRKFLKDKDIITLEPKNALALVNANTPEEYRDVIQHLKEKR